MNCDTCGKEYGDELKQAKAALEVAVKERNELFTPRELNMAIDSVSRNYGRLRDFHAMNRNTRSQTELQVIAKEMEELRLFHLRLVKWKRQV